MGFIIYRANQKKGCNYSQITKFCVDDEDSYYTKLLLEQFYLVCTRSRYYEAYVITPNELMTFFYHYNFYPIAKSRLKVNLAKEDLEDDDNQLMHVWFSKMS